MKPKKVMRERDEHGPRHVTPAGRSVFYDLFPKAEALGRAHCVGCVDWSHASLMQRCQRCKMQHYERC
jgi:hypothetical protein